MHLKHLPEDSIIFTDKHEKQHILREMLTTMQEQGRIANVPRYYAQVIHRESLENTGIGNGFAIPHARTETVDKLQMVFAILDEPIEYDSHDGQPVKYILLSLFPSTYSTTYLYYISMFATIFSDDEILKQLETKKTPAEVHSLLADLALTYYENIDNNNDADIDQGANLAGVPTADLDLLVRLDRLYKLYDKTKDASLEEKINSVKHLIDNRSLTYYNRMRQKSKTPFAFIEKNACSGCNMNIPPIELNAVMERSKIAVCSNCGRFLLYV